MRLFDLQEKSRQTVTLFRGDSSMVDEFQMDKTDARALVGQGIYLTTSFDVAKDYTIKGSDVLYRSEEGEADDPRGFVYNMFYNQLQPIVTEVAQAAFWAIRSEVSNMDRIFSDEIDATIGTGREAQQSERYNELNAWRNAAYKYATPYAVGAAEGIIAEFVRGIYDVEYPKFKASFKNTRMLTTVLDELIIIPEEKLGHVSRFRAPIQYLESKFYRVDDPMSDEDIKWMVEHIGTHVKDFDRSSTFVDLRYNDDEQGEVRAKNFDQWLEKFKTAGARYAWSDHNVGGKGENPTVMEFIVGTHLGGSISAGFDSDFWGDFREYISGQGYSGLHYAGGTRTGTNTFSGGSPVKHDVYVLWDENEVKGLRVGTKEVGVSATDQRLFTRFKFNYIIKSMLSMLSRYRDDAKRMRKGLKNAERIEEAIQEWFKTGELQKTMEQAYASIKTN